jgi:hypothetical protein
MNPPCWSRQVSWSAPSPPTPEAAEAYSPAGSLACAIAPRRPAGAWGRARAPSGVRCAAPHVRPASLSPGPRPKPALPRFGNRRRYCSIAPDRENRGRGARRCCTACHRGAPHRFPGPRGRYRRMRTATDNTIQWCISSARRAILPLQSREQGDETHGAERLAIDPRLTLGVTVEFLAAVRPHRRN